MTPVPVARNLSLILAFLPPWAGYLLAALGWVQDPTAQRALGVGFMIEFLALHSFAFMSHLAMVRAERKMIGVVIVMTFSLGFSAAGGLAVVNFQGGADDLMEWRVALQAGYGVLVGWLMFASAIGFTYMGWLAAPPDEQEMARLKLRWGVALTLFFLVFFLMAFLNRELGVSDAHALSVGGFVYFFGLHVLEMMRFYELRWIPSRYLNRLPDALKIRPAPRRVEPGIEVGMVFWSLGVAAAYALLYALVMREPGAAVMAAVLAVMTYRAHRRGRTR